MRLSEAPSTPSLSTEIQYIQLHTTLILMKGKEIPVQLQCFKDCSIYTPKHLQPHC